MEKVTDSIQHSAEQAQENLQKVFKDTYESASAVSGNMSNSTQTVTSDFLQSNSIVAKAAFLLLVLVVFVILLNLGINILGYFLRPSSTPYIVSGILQGNEAHTVSQDPKQTHSIPVTRSNDQTTGMEFTWSVWLNITDNTSSTYQNIFNKGNAVYSTPRMNGVKGIASVNNGPGLYLCPLDATTNENSLIVVMDTMDMTSNTLDKSNTITITEIPFNKWVNVMIRLEIRHWMCMSMEVLLSVSRYNL